MEDREMNILNDYKDKESLVIEGLRICNSYKEKIISNPPTCAAHAGDVLIDTYLQKLEEIIRITASLELVECLSYFLEHDLEEHPDWWHRDLIFKSIVQAGFPKWATNKILPNSIPDNKQDYYIKLCWQALIPRYDKKIKGPWKVISDNTFELLYKTATHQTPWVDKNELLTNVRKELDAFVEDFRVKNGGSWDLSMGIG